MSDTIDIEIVETADDQTSQASSQPAPNAHHVTDEVVVRIENLTKSFDELQVLRGVDLNVHRGEVVVILGPSGSGKSTLLRCVNLLEVPTSGKIFFEDTEITAKDVDINAVRAKLGMVFQSFNLFPHLTAKKNVMLAQRKVLKRSEEEAEAKAIEELTKVGLAERIDYNQVSFRVVSNSAWLSPARLPWIRTSCCSMKLPVRLTPSLFAGSFRS